MRDTRTDRERALDRLRNTAELVRFRRECRQAGGVQHEASRIAMRALDEAQVASVERRHRR